MLENLIIKRGGLEGDNKSEYRDYLNQQEFEVFFNKSALFNSPRTNRFVSELQKEDH